MNTERKVKTMDNITELCESARNSIEAINEESGSERLGICVSMQDIFAD